MADHKRLPLDKIHVPEDRLRNVDDDKAFLIGQSIASNEQIHPVTVYASPRAARPYTLAAGATRYRGHELWGLKEIDVIVRKLDKAGARRIEIEENLFRNELSKLDRALHVAEYRRLWEEEHGWNKGGRPRVETSANLAEVSTGGAQAHFFEQALDDLGLSRRAIERAQHIASRLIPELRKEIVRTPVADNQSELEKLAKMEPAKQKQTAIALQKTGDLREALRVVDHKPKAEITQPDRKQQEYGRLVDAWGRASSEARNRFLNLIGAAIREPGKPLPSASEVEGGVPTPGRSRSSTRSGELKEANSEQ